MAPNTWADEGRAYYLFKESQVLVHDADLDRVMAWLAAHDLEPRVEDPLISGVTLVGVTVEDLEGTLEQLDDAFGVGVVTPNHVLDVQPLENLCPATEPVPASVDDRWPLAHDPSLGQGVRVAVVDTGFLVKYASDPQTPWLAGVDVEGSDPDDDAYLPDGRIAPYGGHGTFSAGVVLSTAPSVEVTVDDVLVGGVVDEATIVKQLVQALAKSPDVISLSAGAYTRKNVPPKAFTAFYDHLLQHHKGVALVAAAGNNGGREPFWPAAFPWALSVGALTRSGDRRTSWTNHGGWVDVYAPGEDVVNAFPAGDYEDLEGQVRSFTEPAARWSGTSFATPLVAGLVARRMALTGENGQEAVESLKRLAQLTFLPGVGPRLLP
ncbi:MAG: S8 family peptidase [Motilibacteraceae bacterium]